MELNKYIDHTLLKADATQEEVAKLCNEAKEYEFYAVCVNSAYVPFVKEELEGTDIKIAAVIGFPLGAMSTKAKVYETQDACENGANEIDMVINLGLLKDKKLDLCKKDIAEVVKAAANYGSTVKVILETCYLSDEEIITACHLSKEAGAAFVKTSTGFGSGGATPHHVKLMRETVGPDMGVKASGGIRDLETALKMIESGANRLGMSAGVDVIKEMKKA